jgi:hypothetical protein
MNTPTQPRTVEQIQSENETLRDHITELTRALIEQATTNHERQGHFGDFRHCASPSCASVRRQIERKL